MRWLVLWSLLMAIIISFLPSFLPEPLVAFFAGLTVGGGAVMALYERIRLPVLADKLSLANGKQSLQEDLLDSNKSDKERLRIFQERLGEERSLEKPNQSFPSLSLNDTQFKLLSSVMMLNSEKAGEQGFFNWVEKWGTKIEEDIYSVSIGELRQEFPLPSDEFRHALDYLIEERLCKLQGGTARWAWNEGYKNGERVYLTHKGISMIENASKKE